MSIADEIDRLSAQRDAGRLTEAEYETAKARLFAEPTAASSTHAPSGSAGDSAAAAVNSLRRSLGDRWIAGVCGGIAKATGVESWIIRLLFALAVLFGGVGFIPYVLLWIFVPPDRPGPVAAS